jgi:alkylation response protein AidB-like acyl-CoA dehydrogenase
VPVKTRVKTTPDEGRKPETMDAHDAGWQRSTVDYIARARALVPLLQAAGPRIDAASELPPDIVDAMHAAGMFRLLLPRSVGGAELDPVTYVQCVEAIASGDGSAAWCMNQGSGCSMSAAYLDPEWADHVFGEPLAVLAWGQGPGAKAIRTEGGWRVTGRWSFASGSRHSTWLGGHCPTFETDGTPIQRPDGRPWDATMLFRREDAEITDTWDVMGLRGTGSDTYAVTDHFVPNHLALTRDMESERRHPGLLYRFSTMNIYAAGFAGVAMGLARATLDAFVKLAREKTPALTQSALSSSQVVQHQLAYNEAKLGAARLLVLKALADAQEALTTATSLTVEHRAAIRLASTFAIHQSREVVDFAYHEAGATAVFKGNLFERRFRDVHTVCQQVQGRSSHFETVGQQMLGVPFSERWL